MKTFDNAIKPTQKPVCFTVQELLQRYKSTSKESASTTECPELFQTIQTDTNRSLEIPDSKIIQQSYVPDSIKMTLKQYEIDELPIVQDNDVILQINHMHSIFKYLQKDDQSQKLSTNTNSQHSITSKQTSETLNNQINKSQSKHKFNQPTQNQQQNQINQKKDVSPKRSTSPYRQFLQRPQNNQNNNQQRSKSPFIKNTVVQKLTPRTTQRTTPSASPFRQAKENNISNINQRTQRTDRSQNKLIQVKVKETHNQNQSHVIVDLSRCPTQRVLIKQDSNRPKMKVELSLKSLIQNGV
ncbi:unnamed protein product [Paramecium pentaurelia]|uniref:Uncharacterized protein n=1 Tax=Paramecium pentaurelia TaxID=43138 RepID=A0A8S1VWX8_9CILI|nr:unnamed protein product [Paramecium pentaurelia]